MVQHCAARFVANTCNHYSSVTTIMSRLQWKNLEGKRSKACIIFEVILVYKIITRLVCIQPEPYFIIQPSDNLNLQCMQPLHYIPTCFARTDYLKFSFFYRSTTLWNSLPKDTPLRETQIYMT